MDIRCPSCATLYDFDEARIGPNGVNVRCSACGQVFKVRTAAENEDVQWMVKRSTTGEVIYFDELSTLQRWIIEQKVHRGDQISKTGGQWRPLGSIQELSTFFKVVDELTDAEQRPRQATDGHLAVGAGSGAVGGATHQIAALGGGTSVHSHLEPSPAPRPPALPDVRPANESAPEHSAPSARVRALSSSTVRAVESHVDPPSPPRGNQQVLRPSTGSAGYSLGEDEAASSASYSLGDLGDPWQDAAPVFEDEPAPTATPRASESGSIEFDTSDLQAVGAERRRGPVVLTLLLVILCLALVLVAVLRPEMLGLSGHAGITVSDSGGDGREDPLHTGALAGSGVAEGSAADAADATVALATDEAGEGTGRVPAEGAEPGDGSPGGDGANGADGAQGTDASAAGTDAQDGPSGSDSAGDAGARDDAVAAAGDASPPPRDETAPRDRPAPTREDRPRENQPRDPDPTPAAPGGYDGLMASASQALAAGDPQTALNFYSEAAEARESSAEAHVGVARAYESMGRHDLAMVRYQRATRVNGRYTPAWLGLGDAARRNGDTARAIDAYERVLSIVPSGSTAERARRALEELR